MAFVSDLRKLFETKLSEGARAVTENLSLEKKSRGSPSKGGDTASAERKTAFTCDQNALIAKSINLALATSNEAVIGVLSTQQSDIDALKVRCTKTEEGLTSTNHGMTALQTASAQQNTEIATLKAQVESLKSMVEAVGAQDVSKLVDRVTAVEVAQEASASASIAASSDTAVAPEPILAIANNLGWDTQGHVLCDRLKTVLQESGVESTAWHSISALTRRKSRDATPVGSSCQLVFRSMALLDEAAARVRSHPISPENNARTVTLSVKRSVAENRPARLIHRAHECLSAHCSAPLSAEKLVKYPYDRVVKYDGEEIGFVSSSSSGVFFQWTARGREHFSDDLRNLCKAFAEA